MIDTQFDVIVWKVASSRHLQVGIDIHGLSEERRCVKHTIHAARVALSSLFIDRLYNSSDLFFIENHRRLKSIPRHMPTRRRNSEKIDSVQGRKKYYRSLFDRIVMAVYRVTAN